MRGPSFSALGQGGTDARAAGQSVTGSLNASGTGVGPWKGFLFAGCCRVLGYRLAWLNEKWSRLPNPGCPPGATR